MFILCYYIYFGIVVYVIQFENIDDRLPTTNDGLLYLYIWSIYYRSGSLIYYGYDVLFDDIIIIE